MEFVLARLRRRQGRQPRRRVRDPVLSGDVPRHVFAVRHPPAAALGAELGAGVRHGLRHLHRRQHRRHARHHFHPHSVDRHARDHAHARCRRHRVRPRADRAAETRGAPAALALRRSPCWPLRMRAPTTWSMRRSAPKCSSAPDGRVAHIETEYNDIFITKRRNQLTMSFQLKGFDYTELVANLTDPDDLPVQLHAGDDGRRALSARAEARADDRARRRVDLELSRPLHARGRDRHRRRSTPAWSRRRRNISA